MFPGAFVVLQGPKRARAAQQAAIQAYHFEQLQRQFLATTCEGGRYTSDYLAANYIADPAKHGFIWDAAPAYWIRCRGKHCDILMADPPEDHGTAFWLDRAQIEEIFGTDPGKLAPNAVARMKAFAMNCW